jgi:hypothetical protein
MNVDIQSLTIRLENIKRRCEQLLDKDHHWFRFDDHEYLWTNFEKIRALLCLQYPGGFDDIPKRTLRTEPINYDDDLSIPKSAVELLSGDIEDCLQYLRLLPNENREFKLEITAEQSIPEHVRRDIFDFLRLHSLDWFGRLDDVEFLKRLYNLEDLSSTDSRFKTASGDIWQHRINNTDWEADWVFTDERFELLNGPDSILLKFLCQTIHPVVRQNTTEVTSLLDGYNSLLSKAGWQIVAQTTIGDKPIYSAARSYSSMLKMQVDNLHQTVSSEYVTNLLNRMHASIETDPELAIGSAKELVESVCRTVLNDQGVVFSRDDNVQTLVKKTLKELNLDPDDMPHTTKALDSIKPLLKSLGTISHMLAELRGQFGSGHGKDARAKGLGPRHAKLAVGASSALAVFLYETYLERGSKPGVSKTLAAQSKEVENDTSSSQPTIKRKAACDGK